MPAGGGILLRGKWEVRSERSGAVAIYQGRKGIMAAATLLSDTASAEQDGAIGSEVKFEILGRDGDHTVCAMWLASRGSRLGFTADGRFFRPICELWRSNYAAWILQRKFLRSKR